MKLTYYLLIIFVLTLTSCSKMRDSAGVTRKSIDEFQVVENPPLIIPPDFNLLPPEQLEEKNINNIESDLAKEILFGLDEDTIIVKKQISTMNQILSQSGALNVSSTIREEINKEFSQEVNVDDIFKFDWSNEVEVLDAVKESERLRNKNFKGESLSKGEIKIKKEIIKKKKSFFFF